MVCFFVSLQYKIFVELQINAGDNGQDFFVFLCLEWILQVEPWWVGFTCTTIFLWSVAFSQVGYSSSDRHESWETFFVLDLGRLFLWLQRGLNQSCLCWRLWAKHKSKANSNVLDFRWWNDYLPLIYSIFLRKLVPINFLKMSQLSYIFHYYCTFNLVYKKL